MTDPVLRRRVPRKLIATAWTGASPLTAEVPDHAGIAQHQLAIACTATPATTTASILVRPIGSGVFVVAGTVNLSTNGTALFLFSAIFDAIKISLSSAFTGGITAAVQLDSIGDVFMAAPGA